MSDQADAVSRLHATLTRRDTPETVAGIIDGALPEERKPVLRPGLARIVALSLKRHFGWSSMVADFLGPVPMDQQVAKARELALLFLDRSLPESDDPDSLEAFIVGSTNSSAKRQGEAASRRTG